MVDQEQLDSVLSKDSPDKAKLINTLEKIFKERVDFINESEEFKDELLGFDGIYQSIIIDLNFSFWIRVSENILEYGSGIHPDAQFKILYNKDIIVKILKGELRGTDAFMKGLIKFEGELSQGLQYSKLFRVIFKFIWDRTR